MQKIFFYVKNNFLIIIFIILLILFPFVFNIFDNESDVIEPDIPLKKETEIIEEQKVPKKIKFDIKGAVNNPGVYEVLENSRVSDAIKISGGLNNDADTSIINLSKNITDEMVIIIYTKYEIAEMKKGDTSIKYIEKECICPKLENDACIEEVITNNDSITDEVQNSNSKVSLNKATLDELMTLTGIGEVKAKAIIEYRNANGDFKNIDEITNVSGIGDATYEKIKDNLTL